MDARLLAGAAALALAGGPALAQHFSPHMGGSHFAPAHLARPRAAPRWSGGHRGGHDWDHDGDHDWRGHFWSGGDLFWTWGWGDSFWGDPFYWGDGGWVGGYDLAPDWYDYFGAPPAPAASTRAPPGYDCDGWRWDAKRRRYSPTKVSCD